MAKVAVRSPSQYLDKASGALREMGLMPEKLEPAPIDDLLEKISDLDQDKIALVARTLGQTEVFNEVVCEQTSKMEIGERYQTITNGYRKADQHRSAIASPELMLRPSSGLTAVELRCFPDRPVAGQRRCWARLRERSDAHDVFCSPAMVAMFDRRLTSPLRGRCVGARRDGSPTPAHARSASDH